MSENENETSAPSPGHPYGTPQRGRGGKPRKTLGTWLWPVVILAIVVLGVWIIIANNHPADPSSGGAGRGGRRGGSDGATPVGAVVATNGDLPIYIDALGTVTPTATVTVHSQVSGILQSIAFTEGQMVTKGQLLAQVDSRPFEASLMQAQGNLARDTAQLTAAKVDLTRYKTLLAQDSISSQQVDSQAALVGQLAGTVQADQAAVDTQKLNLSYAHITAPISGRVGLRQVDAGNYITPGDSNGLVAITQQSPIDVAFTLPEDNVQHVAKRFNGPDKLPVSVLDRDQTKELAKGELLSLDNLIDTTTGTLRAKARFDNSKGALFPSQFVNVRLLVDTLRNVVIVPSSSILRGSDGLFVYVADAKGAVHVHNITTGPSDGEQTAILSGVSPGDKVVTDGTDRLREGSCVVIGGSSGGKGGRNGQNGGQNSDQNLTKKPGFFASLFGGGASSSASASGGKGKKGKGASNCGGGGGTASASEAGPGHHKHSGDSASADSTSSGDSAPAIAGDSSAGTGEHHHNGNTGSAANAGNGGSGNNGGKFKAMLAQLNLTSDQQNQVDAITADARDKAQALDDPDAKRAVHQAANQQITKLLTPAQQAKLKQLRAAAAADGASGQPNTSGTQ